MVKIFVDVYLAYNLGDDLFIDILAKEFPNSEFTLNFVGKSYDEFIKKYNNLSRRRYNLLDKISQKLKIKDTLYNYDKIAKEHDALIFIGGSIFREEDYYKTLLQDRLKMVQAFKKNNKKVFVLGANFGPIKTKNFVDEYREFFSLCDDVCFRDRYSYEIFKDMNNVRYESDIVFQLDVNEKYGEGEDIIGFSIIEPNHKAGLADYRNKYIDSNIRCIKSFIDNGNKCCLMSFCKNEGDLAIINEIINKLEDNYKKKISMFEYNGDIEKAIREISRFKAFIAARFHANIIGLLLNIHIIPIIYSDKTSNMLKDINFSGTVIEIKDIDKLNTYNILVDNKIKYDLKYEKTSSKRQFKELKKFILSEQSCLENRI